MGRLRTSFAIGSVVLCGAAAMARPGDRSMDGGSGFSGQPAGLERQQPAGNAPKTLPLVTGLVEVRSKSPADVGRVALGADAVREFEIVNRSHDTVRLSVVRSTCGCISTTFKDAELKPGGTTTFTIRAAVRGGLGPQQHAAEIEAKPASMGPGEQGQREVLPIEFTPDRTVDWHPKQLQITARAGVEFARQVYVARVTPGDLGLMPEKSTGQGLAVYLPEIARENKYVQRLKVSGRLSRPGVVDDVIRIETVSATTPLIEIPVWIKVLPAVEATPPGFVCRKGEGSAGVSRCTFTLDQRVDGAAAGIQCDSESPGVVRIVEFVAPTKESSGRVTIEVSTSAVKESSLTTSLRVFDPSTRRDVVRIPVVVLP
ncbi:MAG: DUF1573 domain-containing protein [Phycisphaerales bacterium]